MNAAIVKVTPLKDYSLLIAFEDGQIRVLDIAPFLNFGVFQQLKKTENFSRVHVVFDTIEWDCGVDLDPEFIMKKSVPVQNSHFDESMA
jgi:hypothetical protein